MATSRKFNQNRLRIGFIPGIILPVFVFLLMYLVSGQEVPFTDYLTGLWHLHALVKLVTLCVTPNLLLFLYFFKKKHDLAARGVLMATFVYAFIVLIAKAL